MRYGEVAAALAIYEQVLKLDPKHTAALLGRGEAKYRLGDDSAALEAFANAYANVRPFWHADRNCAAAAIGIGRSELRRKNIDAAIASFSGVIARDRTSYHTAYSGRAETLLALGQPIEALADAERAIWLNPYSVAAYRVRSEIYRMLSRPLEAANDDSRAKLIEAYDDLAKLAYRTGQGVDDATADTIEWLVPKLPGAPTVSHRKTVHPASEARCSDGARLNVVITMSNGTISALPFYSGAEGEIRVQQNGERLTFVLGESGCRTMVVIAKPGQNTWPSGSDATILVSREAQQRFEHAFYPAAPAGENGPTCETAVVNVRAYWGAIEVSEDRSMTPRASVLEDAVPEPIEPHLFGSKGCEIEITTSKVD